MNAVSLGAQRPAVEDPMAFRNVLGHFPTGIVLITGIAEDGEPVGMIVGSFTSVSLQPPLVGFLPTVSSHTFSRLRTAKSFCVNVLAGDQEDLCRHFAGRSENKFDSVEWTPAPSGAPVLTDVVAFIDCTFESIADAGDHHIVVGAVQELQVCRPVAPLLFFQGGYGQFAPMSLHAPFETDLIAGVLLAEQGRAEMEWLASSLGAQCTAMAVVNDQMAVMVAGSGSAWDAEARLGERIPLMPPMGELCLSWENEEAIQRWLDRALPSDECSPNEYRERLRAVRKRGWSLTLKGDYRDEEVFAALREYSSGCYTPAQERHIREIISRTSSSYAPITLKDGESYEVDSLLAPVWDSAGKVRLVLRITHLPSSATAQQIIAWADQLMLTATAMSINPGARS
ncbi:flavin reductase [Paeniglutamicibacter gangotriensis]|uniref:Flavin reductase domain-containing protein n=1 Tax=Paeniglutamicibacter gangotriensis Lz1y TaxID=1276920 RepID=M7NEN0_9MICC|nr:flavin reductase [Paeniglutamicibacter gangotriensis]EMR00250.1 flavin reductase domain-containing protein [Paeniglutamicibacter gangotriensis Lz1y]